MKLKVGVQLFSVMTELANDYLKTLENVAKAGYKYVEYVDVPGNSPEEIGNKVKELGLTAIASHVHFDCRRQRQDAFGSYYPADGYHDHNGRDQNSCRSLQ